MRRLRERKLVQWALAYLAGAWVVFEATGTALEAWEIPIFLVQVIHVLLIFGFLVTLVVAWFHGEKGQQRLSGIELLILTGILAVAGGTLSLLGRDSMEGYTPIVREGDNRPFLAVCPFENQSPNPGDAYFAVGAQEELLTKLRSIPSLGLSAAPSSLQEYLSAESQPSIRDIAEELRVGYFLGGSVRIGGGRVVLTVQLVDGGTGEQIWRGRFEEPYSLDTYIDIQAQVAQEIAYRLRAALSPEETAWLQAVPTGNLEAYEYFLRGNVAFAEERQVIETAPTFPSIHWYEEALRLDPDFALAQARLALDLTYVMGRDCSRVRTWAERALLEVPNSVEAQLAVLRCLPGTETDRGIRELERLERAFPNHPLISEELGQWQRTRDPEAGLQTLLRAERKDPRNPSIQQRLQYSFIQLHRYQEALAAISKEAALDVSPPAYLYLREAWIHLLMGNEGQAADAVSTALSIDPGAPYHVDTPHPMRIVERRLTPAQRVEVHVAAMADTVSSRTPAEKLIMLATTEEALRGPEAARIYWDSVRGVLETTDEYNPHFTLLNLALAYMKLGDREQALEAATTRVAAYDGCRASFQGSWDSCTLLARIYAHFGEHEAAVGLLRELLPAPSWLSVPGLRADPIWDPLRQDPGFLSLLEEYGSR